MKLYHGSNAYIDTIDFNKCKPFKDFGKGFYLTEINEQACKMSQRTALIYGGEAIVTSFDFDLEAALNDKTIQIKQFDKPNEECALFILDNRNRENPAPVHSWDIVSGPVADDAIAMLFRNYDDEIIDLKQLVQGLKYKNISSQYFFHTPNAIKYLKHHE